MSAFLPLSWDNRGRQEHLPQLLALTVLKPSTLPLSTRGYSCVGAVGYARGSGHKACSQTGSLCWGSPTVAGCAGFADPCTSKLLGRCSCGDGEQVWAPSRTGKEMPDSGCIPALMGTTQNNPDQPLHLPDGYCVPCAFMMPSSRCKDNTDKENRRTTCKLQCLSSSYLNLYES